MDQAPKHRTDDPAMPAALVDPATAPDTSADPAGPAGADVRREQLSSIQSGTDTASARAFWHSLPPAADAELLGFWAGSVLPTGHRLDGVLGALGWYGKRFDGPDDCFPLIFTDGTGGFHALPPALVPWRVVLRLAPVLHRPAVARLLRRLLPLLRTRRPGARLRQVQAPGAAAPTATMIYDALPINDMFRRVDADTVLGLMDARGMDQPFFFILSRRPTP